VIYAKSAGSAKEFESLLDSAVNKLSTTIRVLGKMSNEDFEEAVANAMNESATGTPFDGHIERTAPRDFPDITAGVIYGVEVKKTSKDEFKTTGNSVFEQARVDGVEHIYLVMANPKKAIWRTYDSVLENIVVTHSPRYAINAECAETVFERMETDYESFRNLSQEKKMGLIRGLYKDSSLWWLLVDAGGTLPWRFWSGLSPEDKQALRIQALILCPEGLSKSLEKFHNVAVLAISKGIVIPNVRDIFTAGGSVTIDGTKMPHIMGHVRDGKDDLRNFCITADTEMLAAFWGVSIPSDPAKRWERWMELARTHAGDNIDIALG